MNKDKFNEFVTDKSERDIDSLIDNSIGKMRRNKRKRHIITTMTLTVALFVSYVVLLNTNATVQAFALETPILQNISKPLVFNDIFKDLDTNIYSDDLIDLEIAETHKGGYTIEREALNTLADENSLIPVTDIKGSSNHLYYYSFKPEVSGSGVYDVIDSIWKIDGDTLEKIYTFDDLVTRKPVVLAFNDIVYIVEGPGPYDYNYYDNKRPVVAVKSDGTETVFEGHEKAIFELFKIIDNMPHYIFSVAENGMEVIRSVNLVSHEVDTLGSVPSFRGIRNVDVASSSMLVEVLSSIHDDSCQMYATVDLIYVRNGMTANYKACAGDRYTLVTDSIILGMKNENPGDYYSPLIYHVINVEDDTEYNGGDVTEAYKAVGNSEDEISVLRLRSKDGRVISDIVGKDSGIEQVNRVSDEYVGVILVGSYNEFVLEICKEIANEWVVQARYRITPN